MQPAKARESESENSKVQNIRFRSNHSQFKHTKMQKAFLLPLFAVLVACWEVPLSRDLYVSTIDHLINLTSNSFNKTNSTLSTDEFSISANKLGPGKVQLTIELKDIVAVEVSGSLMVHLENEGDQLYGLNEFAGTRG
jgi:hypothetical protein